MKPNDPRFIDLTGRRFGRWLVLDYARRDGGKHRWLCLCDCGSHRDVFGDALRKGISRSCGCFRADEARRRSKVGAWSARAEYGVWRNMIDRCHNGENAAYENYGARGLGVCLRWRQSFARFLQDMGPRPSRAHSIERIDNDEGYRPENCKWALRSEQNRNKRTNRLITIGGETKTLQDWSDESGVAYTTLFHRLKRGEPPEHAVKRRKTERSA